MFFGLQAAINKRLVVCLKKSLMMRNITTKPPCLAELRRAVGYRKYIKSPNNTDPEGYRIRISLQEIALYNLRRMNKKRTTSTVRTYFQTVRFL